MCTPHIFFLFIHCFDNVLEKKIKQNQGGRGRTTIIHFLLMGFNFIICRFTSHSSLRIIRGDCLNVFPQGKLLNLQIEDNMSFYFRVVTKIKFINTCKVLRIEGSSEKALKLTSVLLLFLWISCKSEVTYLSTKEIK